MPIQKLILGKPDKNSDDSSLDNSSRVIQDGYLDSQMRLYRRPGFKLFCDFGQDKGVDGLWWSEKIGKVFAICNGRTFKINNTGGAFSDITSATQMIDNPANFTEAFNGSDHYVFSANGNRITYFNDANNSAFITDADAPTGVTHITNFNTMLVVNNENGFSFSNPNAPLAWDTPDNYDAESSTDQVVAIFNDGESLYICGNESIEQWFNGGEVNDPFLRRLNASYVKNGLYNGRGITSVNIDGSTYFCFIDKNRRIVLASGNQTKVLSYDYDKYVQALTSINDVTAFNIVMNGKSFILFNFIQDKKTLVYDHLVDAWYEWGYWNNETAEYEAFKGRCFCFAKAWNKYLIGDRSTGKVYELSEDYDSDDGAPIRSMFESGWINHGSDMQLKDSLGLVLRVKRGQGKSEDSAEAPYLQIRKADNGKTTWSGFKSISLGAIGDDESRITAYRGRGGKYFSRKYQIVLPDNASCVISGIWENVAGKEVR